MRKKKILPGFIFESISKHTGGERSRPKIDAANFFGGIPDPTGPVSKNRMAVFNFLIIGAAVFFLFALFNLTIVRGDENRKLADENRIRLVDIEAERGQILDRNGKVLAQSQTSLFLKKEPKFTKITQEQAGDLKNQGFANENF